MSDGPSIRSAAASFAVIVTAYVLCHGMTVFLVTPVQGRFLTEITTFASLIYLPHGIRVLATWLVGPKAFLPLLAGGVLSAIVFAPEVAPHAFHPAVISSIVVGAASAPLAFGATRLIAGSRFPGTGDRMNWKLLILAGMVASIINSVGQRLVLGARFPSGDAFGVMAVYALGDLVGLVVTMIVLMMIFRWIRTAER